MMMIRFLVPVIAMTAALATEVTDPTLARQTETPVAESGVEETVRVVLVQLPLIATDRKGNPITDLRAEEIIVKQGRRRLTVEYLEPIRREVEGTGPLPAVRLSVDAPGGWGKPLRSTDGEPDYVAFFVDVENDDDLRRQEAVDKSLAFVREDLHPATRAAVFSFDGQLHLDLPFTDDREAIAGGLLQAWGRNPIRAKMNLESRVRGLVNGFEDCLLPGGDSFSRRTDPQCTRDVAREYAAEERPRAEAFLDSLKEMLDFLGGISGRKTVVAVSHGVAADPVPVIAEALRGIVGNSSQIGNLQLYMGFGETPARKLQDVQRLAVQNKVTLHFLDRSAAPTSDFGAKSGRILFPGTAPAKAAFTAPQADLQELAATSGGIFLAMTDVTSGLRRIERGRSGSYELGYRLDAPLSDRQLGHVKVSTTRRGVRLNHRRGFKAPSRTQPADGRIVIEPVTERPAAGAVGKPHRFTLEFAPRQIGYREGETDASATFTLFVEVADGQGRERVGSCHLIQHSYPIELWKADDVAPVTIRGWVELPSGEFILRAKLRNTLTGWDGEIVETIVVTEVETGSAEPESPISPEN
jgi:VWFA-related protein